MALGETLVHAEQVAGPEVRLLAALGALDLDDRVAALVRVARQQEVANLGCKVVDAGVLLGDLGLEVLPHLAVVLAVEQLAGGRGVVSRRLPLAIGVDEGLQLSVAPAGLAAARGGRRTHRSRAGRTPTARARPRVL